MQPNPAKQPLSRTRRPRFQRVRKRPPLEIQERDITLLKWIYDLRFATAQMLQQLLPPAAPPIGPGHAPTQHNRGILRRLQKLALVQFN